MKIKTILTPIMMGLAFMSCADKTPEKTVASAPASAPSGVQCTLSLDDPADRGGLDDINVAALELGELGAGLNTVTFALRDPNERAFTVDVVYKALPGNRSYPANLDITLKDDAGNKRGYLFFAINDLQTLVDMGNFGFITDVDGISVDLNIMCSAPKGNLRVADLGDERLISDTLMGKKGFQMIRPMLLPQTDDHTRSQSFALDNHPFAITYSLVDRDNGGVQFQCDLSRKTDAGTTLAARFYYDAPTLAILRQGMFAGKVFDADYGPIKLVYYPAMGQTMPPK